MVKNKTNQTWTQLYDQRNTFNALQRDIRSRRLAKHIDGNKDGPRRVHQIVSNAMSFNVENPRPPEKGGVNVPEAFINH